MRDCAVCEGVGGWRIPGLRDWGTCAECKGAGTLTPRQHELQLDYLARLAQRDRQLHARVEAGRTAPEP